MCTLRIGQDHQAMGLTSSANSAVVDVQVATLQRLDAGAMYFWMKDLTQELLKLSIIYSSVEIFDKVLWFRFLETAYHERGLLPLAVDWIITSWQRR